jgi:hypothetical protein
MLAPARATNCSSTVFKLLPVDWRLNDRMIFRLIKLNSTLFFEYLWLVLRPHATKALLALNVDAQGWHAYELSGRRTLPPLS